MVDYFQQQPAGARKRPITVSEVPSLPRYLTLEQAHLLLPPGYDDMVQLSVNKTIPERPTIVLSFLNPESAGMSIVEIPQTLFNSQVAEVDVPMFLFERSSLSTGNSKMDYFGTHSFLRRNVVEVMYQIIQNRLAQYARKERTASGKKRRVFVNLLASDFRRLKKFIQFEAPSTFNGYLKVQHTYAVLSARAMKHHTEFLLGEAIENGNPDEKAWKRILKDLQGYVQTSSESSMSQRGKLTLYPGQLYRSVGYAMSEDGKTVQWICASKQNIPARMKTHVLSDSYALVNPVQSCFQQDNLFANGVMSPKDNTLKEVVVVYSSMDGETKRFVAGEIEASASIAEELVHASKSIDVTFRSEEDICVEVGTEYFPEFHPYSIGLDFNDDEVLLYDIKSFVVKEIVPNGINGSYKVYINAIMRAGNARIISNTGHKGVTKIKPYNGKVYMPKEEQDFNQLDLSLLNYVQSGKYNKYTRITSKQIPETWNRLKVDLVMGMNAVKAKSNTIVLSQAALAVKLGYYSPVPKGSHGQYLNILDTLDVDEINDAANSLPSFIYTNEFGVPEKVFVGLAYISYTELGSVYTEFKPQSFAFESGWGIKNNSEELFKHIRENYLEEDRVAVAKELYKIINDPKGLLKNTDKIPSYTVKDIREKRMFNPTRDLFKQRTTAIMSRSKLIDPAFNPNGFYINLRPQNGPLIRIPSAATFRTFIKRQPNGEIGYHQILFNVSKIIQSILGFKEEFFEDVGAIYSDKSSLPRPNLEWIFNYYKNNDLRTYQYDLYMTSIQGTLYSTEDSAEMIVQSLVKPKIPGVNMKQVVEPLLPDDVVVIMDNRIYNRICKQAEHEDLLDPLSMLNINIGLLKDYNISENKLQYTELWQDVLNNVPHCLAIRNPSLWESQITNPRIWSIDHLAIWLKFKYNINLKRYLHTKYNRDIVLVSPEVALISHSDCDGDLLPMAVLNKIGQALLKHFKLHDMLVEEAAWNEEYWRDELETDEDLKINGKHVYELFTISNSFDPTGRLVKNYPQYLLNASIAKENIGPATIDIWALKGVLQWYRAYSERTNYKFLNPKTGEVIDRLTHRLTDHDMKYLPYVYTRLVQEQVIEAIKHMEGGSDEFKMYFLDNLTSDKHMDVVQRQLEHKFKVPKAQIVKLLGIIAFAIACDDALKGIKNFITKFNKGKIPQNPAALDQWAVEIQSTTYFGSLIKPLFDISQDIKQLKVAKAENNLTTIGTQSFSMASSDSLDNSKTIVNDLFDMS